MEKREATPDSAALSLPSTVPLSLRLSWGPEAWKHIQTYLWGKWRSVIHAINLFWKEPPPQLLTDPHKPTSALAPTHSSGAWTAYILKTTLSLPWVFLMCPFPRTVSMHTL